MSSVVVRGYPQLYFYWGERSLIWDIQVTQSLLVVEAQGNVHYFGIVEELASYLTVTRVISKKGVLD